MKGKREFFAEFRRVSNIFVEDCRLAGLEITSRVHREICSLVRWNENNLSHFVKTIKFIVCDELNYIVLKKTYCYITTLGWSVHIRKFRPTLPGYRFYKARYR